MSNFSVEHTFRPFFGLALLSFGVVIASSNPSFGQNQDANIQQSLELFLPDTAPTPTVTGRRIIPKPAPEPEPEPVVVDRPREEIIPEIEAATPSVSLQSVLKEKGKSSLWALSDNELAIVARDHGVAVKRKAPAPKKTETTPLIFSASASASSTSNALFSPTNEQHDEIGTLQFGLGYTPKLNESTTLILRSGLGSARNNKFETQGKDAINGAAAIQYAVKDSSLAAWLARGDFTPSESYTFEFGTTSSFAADFKGSAKMLYGLSAKWALDGIPLSSDECEGPSGKTACVSIGTSLAIAQTYTSFEGGENLAAILRADLTWRPRKDLAVKAGAGVKPKTYPGDGDGHDDVVISVGSSLEWAPNKATTISATFDYETQDSSIDANEYDVFVVKPGVLVKVQLN